MGIKFFDYDNDGRMDLLLTDMHSDMSEDIGPEREKLKSRMQWAESYLQGGANNIFGNALYHNVGGGKFEEVSDRLGVENYWPWGVSVGDVNADGWDDVFITSGMGYPFRYGINTMLLNDRGEKFLDCRVPARHRAADGRSDPHARGSTWTARRGRGRQRPRAAGGRAGSRVMTTLSSRSSVMFDLDGDGDLDIVTNDLHAEPMVLVSDLAAKQAASAG